MHIYSHTLKFMCFLTHTVHSYAHHVFPSYVFTHTMYSHTHTMYSHTHWVLALHRLASNPLSSKMLLGGKVSIGVGASTRPYNEYVRSSAVPAFNTTLLRSLVGYFNVNILLGTGAKRSGTCQLKQIKNK